MQFLFRSPSMPSPSDALPGRTEPMSVPARHFVNGASLTGPWPDGTRTAVFALGCFWGAEKEFWETPGVISTDLTTLWGHRFRISAKATPQTSIAARGHTVARGCDRTCHRRPAARLGGQEPESRARHGCLP